MWVVTSSPIKGNLTRNLALGRCDLEQVRIHANHLIFASPCVHRSSFRVPLYIDFRNTALLESIDFVIHNLDRLFKKLMFNVNLNLLEKYNKSIIGEIFLEVRYVKRIVFATEFLG